MKKLISIILIIAIMLMNILSFAEEGEVYGLNEAWESLWISNTSDNEVLINMKETYDEYVEKRVDVVMNAPEYERNKIGLTGSIEEQREQLKTDLSINYDRIIKIYPFVESKYSLQYVENKNLQYLFSDIEYLAAAYMDAKSTVKFENDGRYLDNINNTKALVSNSSIIQTKGWEFIEDKNLIEKALLEKNEHSIDELKIVLMYSERTFLYLRCGNNEYLICIYAGNNNTKEWLPGIEMFKIYEATELIQVAIKNNLNLSNEKPVFLEEATALQEEGLLQGNENGLDLLKPLTRIEAATMLLRAIGEDNFTETAEEEIFTDVPVTHWGCKSAAKAYSLGLIQGIGDNLFAPDKTVTGEEFSTMVLRAAGTDEFDWQEALNILVEKGIITEENTETMDLFTRGDMAKIIYEARENGLL